MTSKEKTRSKSILITGGAGFIGSHLIRHLLQEENPDKVISVDIKNKGDHSPVLNDIINDARYLFIQGSILDKDLLTCLVKKHNIDTIVHLAAMTSIPKSVADPMLYTTTNVVGTANLLEIVRENPELYLHITSSRSVYGEAGDSLGRINENSPLQTKNPYGASKAAVDLIAHAYYQSYGSKITISQPSNTYGRAQKKDMLIASVVRSCLEDKPIEIHGTGQQTRDWLYIDDHIKAIQAIMQAQQYGETYIIGTGIEISNLDVTDSIFKILSELTGKSKEEYTRLIEHVPNLPGNLLNVKLDTSKIQIQLGWKPKEDFKSGIKKTVVAMVNDYYKTNLDELD